MNQNQFFQAISENNIELVKKHVQTFPHINFKNGEKDTPLSLAIKHSRLEIIDVLIENFAEFNNYPILSATLNSNLCNLFDFFLEKKVDIFQKDEKNNINLLMIASKKHLTQYVDLFIKKGMKINEEDKEGFNALDYALDTYHDNDEFFKYLISQGAKPRTHCEKNIKNSLSLAISSSQNLSIIQYLIENFEFNFDEMKKENEYVLDVAFSNNAPIEIIFYLVKSGVKIEHHETDLYDSILDCLKYYDKYEKRKLFEKFNFLEENGVLLNTEIINTMQTKIIDSDILDKTSKYRLLIDLVGFYVNHYNYKLSPIEIDYFLKEESHCRIFENASRKTLGETLINYLQKNNLKYIDKIFDLGFKLNKEQEVYLLTHQNQTLIEKYLSSSNAAFFDEALLSLVDNINLSLDFQKKWVKVCVEKKCNIHVANEDLENIFFYVRHPEIAEIFVNLGVDFNYLSENQSNAFFSINCTPQLVHYFAQIGMDIEKRDESHAFSALDKHLDYRNDTIDLEIVKSFLENGAILNKDLLDDLDEETEDTILQFNQSILEKKQLEKKMINLQTSKTIQKI